VPELIAAFHMIAAAVLLWTIRAQCPALQGNRDFRVQTDSLFNNSKLADEIGDAIGWVTRMNATCFRPSARSPGDNPGFEER
jgi:hypothetical protein